MGDYGYAMHPYFKEMPGIGKPLARVAQQNIEDIKNVEAEIAKEVERVKNSGKSTEALNQKGEMSAWQRLEYLVDPGTWCPLHTIYDPAHNEERNTGVIDGLGKIAGKWTVIIASNNKVMAGAWLAGQADNILRVTDIAKRLRLPLVWVLNCSGAKLMEQEELYANRRGNGTPFFRHAELQKLGIPIIVGIYGTNPAGGGYHSISPTVLIAHKNANMAVGGGGIVGGMNPKGYVDDEAAASLIEETRKFKATPPGRVEIHHYGTGFMRDVCDTEEEVLDDIKKYVKDLPAYAPAFFRVAEPAEPKFPASDLYSLVPFNQKRVYPMPEVLARLFDNSEHMEFKPDYGPEVYCGLAKIDGFLCGFIANNQGILGKGYPNYADYQGIGGKLYREGLIKMSEFVTFCGRDRLPLIWLQDTTGIDVGDTAEKAEMLGLGMSLIYSIEQSDLPMMGIILRKGTAAAHYVLGGPQANNNNVFTLGTATTEVYVMHGETAAAASYARRLVKDKDEGKSLEPTMQKMNDMIKDYYAKSRPAYCAQKGWVDEIVDLEKLRKYCEAFVGSYYQNPASICAVHQMLTPRVIRG
ncbi:carboxyl transferase domain-containing protein [Desulfosporosinus sp. PR]|uniref:acyl-CoA carboxylase subunit beta n=1 Tax=Candidatus Desulfosporosinus nitrosoreducens TaxID=3401928 RepID=UPI0027FC1DA4|nr:carboxyl transferase domain-containing protein [Desulfosporosinus sp. PR]MDQ7096819.1 carboxyl transferase domain-containing protein [Desulfosporosinus sp. PR]